MPKIVIIIFILAISIFANASHYESEEEDYFADLRASYELAEKKDFENAEDENFTFMQRTGTMLLNFYPALGLGLGGLGSFIIMGDIVGGFIQLGLVGGGFVLLLLNQGVFACYENCGNAVQFSIGAIMFLSGSIYGFVRSLTYDKPKTQNAAHRKNDGFNMAILPTEQGDLKAYLFYNKAF
jgi:hypothetical protein